MCVTSTLLNCSHPPPVVVKPLPSAVLSQKAETLDKMAIARVLGIDEGQPYRVGPGDTLLVAVYGHPELSLAPYVSSSVASQSSRLAGLVVDNDGTLQLPLVGSVGVAGKTTDELRQLLERELTNYVKDPKVTVQVVFAGSIRYYLLGEFSSPGLKYSDRPLRLLEALALGGSIRLDQASLRSAYIARAGERLPISFRRLVLDGDLSQNVPLLPGDVVVVPDRQHDQAFVLGGASQSNPRGGTVPFMNGRLNLLQALAWVGFGWKEHFQGHLEETRVIRTEGDRAELYIVDAAAILEGEAAPFELMPGDVVYVPATTLTDWNQAMEQILPSLQTVSGVLNPFVQIKYLTQPPYREAP